MTPRAEVAADRLRQWRHNAVQFVRELFHVEPDEWQKDALTAWSASYRDDPKTQRIALQACVGPGKTAVEVWCAWNVLLCFADPLAGKFVNAYAMSVSGDNLRDTFWKELALWRARSPVLMREFEWTKERVYKKGTGPNGENYEAFWWLAARTWPKSADVEQQGRTLSGLHAPIVAYFIDESGTIHPAVLKAAEQGLSNCEWGKIIQAGNPTDHGGMLYFAAKEQPERWTLIRITADPEEPKRSPRIPIEYAQEQIDTYGRDNPWVMAHILGLFPPASINALLSPDDVHAALGRHLDPSAYQNVQMRLGIDVARFGDDRTVIIPRQGLRAMAPAIMRNARGPDIAARVSRAKTKLGSEAEFIDDTGGYGATVIDSCLQGGITLFPVNFSGSAVDPRYFNKRSELNFLAAEWVKRGGSLPAGWTEIVKEACAHTYVFHQGKLRVIEKDQVKKNLNGHSPDIWDALITTFAMDDVPRALHAMPGFEHLEPGAMVGAGAGTVQSDWNPYE